VLACTLTACSGGGDGQGASAPATLPPITPPSPTAPPTPILDLPTEAAAATPQGAEAFVRFFYTQVQRAYAEQDSRLLKPYVSDACTTCKAVLASLDRLRRENLRVRGYTIEVDEVVTPQVAQEPREVNVTAVLHFSEYVESRADGAAARREPARKAVQDLTLTRTSGWIVSGVKNS
jgi:hypothetical protein